MLNLYKYLICIIILSSSNYLSAQQLNSTKLDVPFYSSYDYETNELVIAGCRFNYMYDKSTMFIAKLDSNNNVVFVKDFIMQDTCIIHIGGLFKEQNGWRIFFTGMADTPYYKANAWGYFIIDNSLQNIIKTQWFPTHNLSLKLSFIKAIQYNSTTYYGTNYADIRERAISSFGKPFYWMLSYDTLRYSYNDSLAFIGDLTLINDTLLFSISNENVSHVFKWHDVKNNHVLTMPYGAIKTSKTSIVGIPSEGFLFNKRHELINSLDSGFVLASSIREDFDNPQNINIDSIYNKNTVQFLIAKFNIKTPVFNTDSVYLNLTTPEVIYPEKHCLTDSRNPELPNNAFNHFSYKTSQTSFSHSIAHNGNYYYFLRSYNSNGVFASSNLPIIKLSCFDNELKLLWEKTLYTENENRLYGDVPFSVIPKKNGCFVITAKGTGKTISDTLWSLNYNECDVTIYSFDSTGYRTLTNKINLSEQTNQITIFPNPASHVVNIIGVKGKYTISVFNTTGTQVIDPQKNNDQIDISQLVNGIYFIKIITEHSTFIKKIIKG